ncbi:hypothetical protein [Rubinisphaera margarita]|uniref:hypothetical protein n=1 Tax=Rubinisphaera margarita TaxID=2909586 RepID=UPI001EE7EBF1|nr:hypothetical protein [Rubinisphaera margarita]MCG6155930.1 hypothetical protein [Rubinisphaera margarita]
MNSLKRFCSLILAPVLLAGVCLGPMGCEVEEEVLDVETPGTELEVDQEPDGALDVDAD